MIFYIFFTDHQHLLFIFFHSPRHICILKDHKKDKLFSNFLHLFTTLILKSQAVSRHSYPPQDQNSVFNHFPVFNLHYEKPLKTLKNRSKLNLQPIKISSYSTCRHQKFHELKPFFFAPSVASSEENFDSSRLNGKA